MRQYVVVYPIICYSWYVASLPPVHKFCYSFVIQKQCNPYCSNLWEGEIGRAMNFLLVGPCPYSVPSSSVPLSTMPSSRAVYSSTLVIAAANSSETSAFLDRPRCRYMLQNHAFTFSICKCCSVVSFLFKIDRLSVHFVLLCFSNECIFVINREEGSIVVISETTL